MLDDAASPPGQDTEGALIVAAEAPAPAPAQKKQAQRRFFKPEWKTTYLATLMCCAKLTTGGVTIAAHTVAAAPFVCSEAANCPGCPSCTLMYCSECMIQGTPGFKGRPNPFVEGCRDFHVKSVQGHQQRYHPNQIQGQTDITEGLAQQCEQQKLKIIDLMKNAHWLAKHRIGFRTFPSLLQLGTDLGLQLSETYCNKNACRDFVLSIAAIVTEDINADARA